MIKKIKVSAPAHNPHICYIPEEYKEKIEFLKKATNNSLYRILCVNAGRPLKTTEQIHDFKQELRKQGYRNIGEWAAQTIDILYETVRQIHG